MDGKVVKVMKTLTDNLIETSLEVDNFMKNIFEWSKEVEEIIRNDCFTIAKHPGDILRIIQSETKRNVRDTTDTIASTTSVLVAADGDIANETASRRTRTRKMTRTKKPSVLNETKSKKELLSAVVKQEDSVITNGNVTNSTFLVPQPRLTRGKSNAVGNVNNETFVMPQLASTRTKPVLRKKKGETISKGTEEDEVVKQPDQSVQDNISHKELDRVADSETFTRTSSEKKCLRSKNSLEQPERVKVSRTSSQSPADRPTKISKTYHETSAKTPINAWENFKENVGMNSSEILATAKADSEKSGNVATHLNEAEKQNSTLKLSKSLINSPVLRESRVLAADTPISSPPLMCSSVKACAPADHSSKVSIGKSKKSSTTKKFSSGTPRGSLDNSRTFLVSAIKENEMSFVKNERNLSKLTGETFTKFSKTSTPVPNKKQKTMCFDEKSNESRQSEEMDFGTNCTDDTKRISKNSNSNSIENESGGVVKNKKKTKREISKENIEEEAPTVRITRTKSKALQQMMDNPEIKQLNDLSAFAKKLVTKAKKNSLKKNHLATLLEKNLITPCKPTVHMPAEIFSSKSKYHLLLSSANKGKTPLAKFPTSAKKGKTPLATLPNSAIKIVKASNEKTRGRPKIARRDSSAENLEQEKEEKLKSKQKKEEEAATKRQIVIKSKQEELKRKNEYKHQLAMKQREKLEQEKYKNMIQSEKEKEERRRLILQERQMKMKEEAFKKKMLTQQKIAETNERRRLEEEARIAKLKEMEAEEQRIALEKQKEQEMLERRAQERLAQKKAREEYEMQLKKELEAEKMKAEKSEKKKLQSASKPQSSKRQKFDFFNEKKEEWDYKPRNEDDYGLEHEETVIDSEDESSYKKTAKSPVPWVKKIMKNLKCYSHKIPLDMLSDYMSCIQKTPDINKMFNITPTKKIKRNSSAIWNTPSS